MSSGFIRSVLVPAASEFLNENVRQSSRSRKEGSSNVRVGGSLRQRTVCLRVREVQCVACETMCACVRMPTEFELL